MNIKYILKDNINTKRRNKFQKFRSLSNSSLKSSAIISLSDFNRMKSSINIFEQNLNKNEFLTPLNNRRYEESFYTNSIQLKNKIIDYDKTHKEERLIKSDYEKEKEKKNKELIKKAQREMEENFDEVKLMNKLMLSAQMATIRDKQVEESKKIKDKNKKIEDKLFLMSEIERLKELNEREKFEKKLNEKKIEGKKELQKQILYNLKLKEEQKKIVKKEYEDIVKYLEKIKKEDEEKIKRDKEKGKKLIKEIIEANKKSLELKKSRKIKEIEEDKKLMEYNKQKALEEEKKQQELKQIQIKKELEIGKIQEKQKILIDNQSLLDEINMKRAFEAAGRAERKKAEEEMKMKQKKVEEMRGWNKKLIDFKIDMINKEAEETKREYDKNIEVQMKERQLEIEREKKILESLKKYKQDLQKIIASKEEEKKMKQREIIEEGRRIKQNQEEYYNRLKQIKQRKIEELKKMNVPEIYIHNLQKYNPIKQSF